MRLWRGTNNARSISRFIQTYGTARETLHRIGKLLYLYRYEAFENHSVDLILAKQSAVLRRNVCDNAGAGHYARRGQTRYAIRLSFSCVYRQPWRTFETRFLLLPNLLSMQCYQWLCNADEYPQPASC
jgi:hypothetical protein